MDFQEIDSNFDYKIDVDSDFYLNDQPNSLNPLNPDDFLTGIKTEIKSEPPSSDYGSNSSNSSGSPVSNILMQPMDTPPQSPPVLLSLPADSNFQILQLANNGQTTAQNQGHLIPITLPPNKKIQIQPAHGPAQPKRTIVLPPKDFQMLMEKMKTSEQNKYIMVKNMAHPMMQTVPMMPVVAAVPVRVLPKPSVPIAPSVTRAIVPKSPGSQNHSSDSDSSIRTNFTSVSQVFITKLYID